MKNQFSVDSGENCRQLPSVVLYALCIPSFLRWRWTNVIYLSQLRFQISVQVLLTLVPVVVFRTVPLPLYPQHIAHVNIINLLLLFFWWVVNDRVVFA